MRQPIRDAIQSIKRLVRRFRGQRAARATGLFDADFYLAQLSDPERTKALRSPWRHYLRVGGAEGLDPGPGFDSEWYLAINSDVRDLGINPLVHYALYGQLEGRLPRLGARPPLLMRASGRASNAELNQMLWAGFEHLVLPLLEGRALRGDARARWHLACWHYGQGEARSALKWLEAGVKPGGGKAQECLAFSKCYTLLGDKAGLESLVRDLSGSGLLGGNLPYVAANAEFNAQKKLDALNSLYRSQGLQTLSLIDVSAGLRFDNLHASSSAYDHSARDRAPLVSVVMSAFNAETTLATALDGVLGQTWPAVEVIVVDDASTDGTGAVIARYCENDARVRSIRNEVNRGAYYSRNRGAAAARGEFVTVHDSDDWSHPEKIAQQLSPLLEDADKVASRSHWVRVTEDFECLGSWLLGEGFLEVNPSSWLVRRRVFETVGYWDNVKVEADIEFALRMEHHYGHRALVVVAEGVPLAFARAAQGSLTRTRATHIRTLFYGLRRLYQESSRWWHRAEAGAPVLRDADRPFSVPLGALKDPDTEFDVVLSANYAVEGEALNDLLKALSVEVASGQRLVLLHWPDYFGWHGNVIADEVFAFAQCHKLHWAHPGLTVSAARMVFYNDELWAFRPSRTAKIERLERIEQAEGALCERQAEMLAYFQAGSVRLESTPGESK